MLPAALACQSGRELRHIPLDPGPSVFGIEWYLVCHIIGNRVICVPHLCTVKFSLWSEYMTDTATVSESVPAFNG